MLPTPMPLTPRHRGDSPYVPLPFAPPPRRPGATLEQHIADTNDPHGTLRLLDRDLSTYANGIAYAPATKRLSLTHDGVEVAALDAEALVKSVADPVDFAPAVHSHSVSDVSGLSAALSEKVSGEDLFNENSTIIKSALLPSYVDDVLEFDVMGDPAEGQTAFPAVGETGKIYVATSTNKTYRWSGSQYVEIANPDLTRYVQTTDPRLSDAREPLPHVHSGYEAELADLRGRLSPLQIAAWYPDGSVTSEADFTAGLLFDVDNKDDVHRTISVFPFFNANTGTTNATLAGRVVIPPYTMVGGVRYTVVGIASARNGQGSSNAVLTEVVAPTTVASVGNYAFSQCSKLTSVSIPAATSLGVSAFGYCLSLETLDLPHVTTVGTSAFSSCRALKTVSLPAATTAIARVFYGCTSIEAIDFGGTPRVSVPDPGGDELSGIETACKVVVPDSQYDDWRSSWSAKVPESFVFVRHGDWMHEHAPVTHGEVDAALAVKAGLSDLSYSIVTPTPDANGKVVLQDRASNVVTPEVTTRTAWVWSGAPDGFVPPYGDPVFEDGYWSYSTYFTDDVHWFYGDYDPGNSALTQLSWGWEEQVDLEPTVTGTSFYDSSEAQLGGVTNAYIARVYVAYQGEDIGYLEFHNNGEWQIDTVYVSYNGITSWWYPFFDSFADEDFATRFPVNGTTYISGSRSGTLAATLTTIYDSTVSTIQYPAAVPGKVRDFLVEVDFSAAPAMPPDINWVAPTGETVGYRTADGSFPKLEKAINELSFTENKEGKFLVHHKVVKEVP